MSATKRFRNTIIRLRGRAKERIGEATGNMRQLDEGRADQVRARLRNAAEHAKEAFRGR